MVRAYPKRSDRHSRWATMRLACEVDVVRHEQEPPREVRIHSVAVELCLNNSSVD